MRAVRLALLFGARGARLVAQLLASRVSASSVARSSAKRARLRSVALGSAMVGAGGEVSIADLLALAVIHRYVAVDVGFPALVAGTLARVTAGEHGAAG